MAKSETVLIQEHVRYLVSEIKNIKADFARYHTMAERHTQDEIEDADHGLPWPTG